MQLHRHAAGVESPCEYLTGCVHTGMNAFLWNMYRNINALSRFHLPSVCTNAVTTVAPVAIPPCVPPTTLCRPSH